MIWKGERLWEILGITNSSSNKSDNIHGSTTHQISKLTTNTLTFKGFDYRDACLQLYPN